jgi:AraC family transcriptional regulator of adaptative response / DNA-3-methyladenine glycosylase II
MRLICDGVVDREGVPGLAGRLGYSSRHLNRVLTDELGAGPLALARARRAQQARTLLERTTWPLGEVAYAAGFSSVRQFNDTFLEVYATTPTQLRGRLRSSGPHADAGGLRLDLRLPVRTPFDGPGLWRFLAAHLTPGVESAGPQWYARSLSLPHGPAVVRIDLGTRTDEAGAVHGVPVVLRLTDVRDVAAGTERCRRLLDADCDPVTVHEALSGDPRLEPLVAGAPGVRVPGHVDGDELAVRTVLGQQVSVAAGNRLSGRFVRRWGEPLPPTLAMDGLDRVFPAAGVLAAQDPADIPVPRARGRALCAVAGALAEGSIALDRRADRVETRRALLGLPGVGPWTADYVAMRALGDPDVFPTGDLALQRAIRTLEGSGTGRGTAVVQRDRTAAWRPWRSYAAVHLWRSVATWEAPS